MNTIKNLVNIYLSDKNASGYSDIYDLLFPEYKDKKINLLEIGIGTLIGNKSNMLGWKNKHTEYLPGASLRVWKEYFYNANIFGIDIQEDCIINEDRITTFICDSTCKKDVSKINKGLKFDIIIDDGLHTFEAQNKTFNLFYPKLNDGGIYFIEDINDISLFHDKNSCLFEYVDRIQSNNKGNLLWIKK